MSIGQHEQPEGLGARRKHSGEPDPAAVDTSGDYAGTADDIDKDQGVSSADIPYEGTSS